MTAILGAIYRAFLRIKHVNIMIRAESQNIMIYMARSFSSVLNDEIMCFNNNFSSFYWENCYYGSDFGQAISAILGATLRRA